MWYVGSQGHFLVLWCALQVIFVLQQSTSLRNLRCLLARAIGIDSQVIEVAIAIADAWGYLTDLFINRFYLLILNFELWANGAERAELANLVVHNDLFSSMFYSLPELCSTLLRIVLPRPEASLAVALNGAGCPCLHRSHHKLPFFLCSQTGKLFVSKCSKKTLGHTVLRGDPERYTPESKANRR